MNELTPGEFEISNTIYGPIDIDDTMKPIQLYDPVIKEILEKFKENIFKKIGVILNAPKISLPTKSKN